MSNSDRQLCVRHLTRCYRAEFRPPVKSVRSERYDQWMAGVIAEIEKEPEPAPEDQWNSLFGRA
jgi:hypothetical protein